MNNILIIKIIAHENFTITIYLNNGKFFVFDIKPYLSSSGFKKLRQISFFKQVKFKDDLLYWDDMHDFPLHCMNIPDDVMNYSPT